MERRGFVKWAAATAGIALWGADARAEGALRVSAEGVATSEETAQPTTPFQNTPTKFIEANGIKHAYRRFGANTGSPPLVCIVHYRGTMDSWDPAIMNRLAADREIVLFDNAGIGRSGGTTPDNIADMAAQAFNVVRALGLTTIDLYGFSIGGFIAQQIVLDHPDLVRRLILNGTAPHGGEGFAPPAPEVAKFLARPPGAGEDLRVRMFFASSGPSQAAGMAFVERTKLRKDDREPGVSPEAVRGQSAAIQKWGAQEPGNFAYLRQISQPTLVVNGDQDIIVPTVNSYHLKDHLPNAQLIIYPDSGHGSQFQYPRLFCSHVNLFLQPSPEWPT